MIKRCSTRACNKEAVRMYGGFPRCGACVKKIRERQKLWRGENRPRKNEFNQEYDDKYKAKPTQTPRVVQRVYKAGDIQRNTPEKVTRIVNGILQHKLTYVIGKKRPTTPQPVAKSAPKQYNTVRRQALQSQGVLL